MNDEANEAQLTDEEDYHLEDTWIERAIKKIPTLMFYLLWGVTALLMYPIIGGVLLRDADRIEDNSMLWRDASVATSTNAYMLTEELRTVLFEPESPGVSLTKLIEGGAAWDNALAKEISEKNVRSCAIVSEAAKMTSFEVPQYMTGRVESLFEASAVPMEWRSASRVCALTAIQMARKGQIEKAIRLSGDIVRVGDMISHAQLPTVGYLLGSYIRLTGLSAIRTIALSVPVSAKHSLLTQKVIAPTSADSSTVIIPLRGEFLTQVHAVEQIANGNVDLLSNVGLKDYRRFAKWSLYLQPNRTVNDIAQIYKRIMTEASRSCIDYVPYLYRRNLELPSMYEAYFRRNVVGELVRDFVITPPTGLVEKRCNDEVNLRITDLVMAVRAYYYEHGRYPTTLDALFPGYLVTWPIDPYSGLAFHYDKEDLTISSLGPKQTELKEGGYSHDSTGLIFTFPE